MVTIFMPLLDEDVEVWRPVEAQSLTNGTYCIMGHVPEDELWAFPPGTLVRCEWKTFSGGERVLVALAL